MGVIIAVKVMVSDSECPVVNKMRLMVAFGPVQSETMFRVQIIAGVTR